VSARIWKNSVDEVSNLGHWFLTIFLISSMSYCRPIWGDVRGWLLELEQHRHLFHCVKANDWVVQRALPKSCVQADGRAPAAVPRRHFRRSHRQGYLWLDSLRWRFRPQCCTNAVGDPPCTRPKWRLHLRVLRCPATAHALLPEQWLRLDRFAPLGCKAHYLDIVGCECSIARRPQLPLGLHYEEASPRRSVKKLGSICQGKGEEVLTPGYLP